MSEKKKQVIAISLIDIIDILKKDKKKIILYCCVAGILGLMIAFTTPKIYKSSVVLAPEESGQGFSGSISSLASMVGMNMRIGQTGDAIYPEIYPDVVSSVDFVLGLFPVQIKTMDGNVKCDYYTYLTKHQKVAWVDYPMVIVGKALKSLRETDEKSDDCLTKSSNGVIRLSSEQYGVVRGIAKDIECGVDKKTNVITITVTDQDPLVAAIMADSIREHLQTAITNYRTKKACADLEYMQKLFDEAKSQYDHARRSYASYADANMDISLQSFKSKEEDLENEMQLKYNIYQTIVEQLQLAKAKVQERTPAFTILQSATVPIRHSSRSKIVTLILWSLLGFIIRTCILAWKNKETLFNA